jgi:DNA-binding response OmpR family regulator/anti-sigma regulatory factor (Ser/Thr protein kinase)
MKKHILLIEDDPQLSENISELLTLNDFAVTLCNDGKKAIDLIKNNADFDLIISDIVLPNYTGLEILAFVREEIYNKQIPFIFLSAKTELTDIRAGMNMGADDYLTKPFQINDLLHLINLRLDKKTSGENRIFKELSLKLDEFPKILSHELNTPMNGILSLAYAILNNYDKFSEEEIKDSLKVIITSCERLVSNQKKLFSYLELSNQTNKNIQQILSVKDIAIAIDALLNNYLKKEENRNNKIVLFVDKNVEESSFTADIGKNELLKIVNELLENSLKHSKKETPITISINIKNDKLEIYVSNFTNSENNLELDLNLNKNFLDSNRSLNGHQGYGVGLLLVQKLCKLNDAEFFYEFEKEKITFFIKINLK